MESQQHCSVVAAAAEQYQCIRCATKGELRCSACKKVHYCSKTCQRTDWPLHKKSCKAAVTDQRLLEAAKSPHRFGSVGLRNMGNTCYMNSVLQCLSHTPPLSQYFLVGPWADHLNRTNVLGSKGKLAEAYNKFLWPCWYGKQPVLAPGVLRKEMGGFAPEFAGYEQHDAHEFFTRFVDQLHEDVNRVVLKQVVEAPEWNGRPDHVVATEAWEGHKKRNDSVVVDTMTGLLKSTVQCSECGKVAIKFDPFTALSLPLAAPAACNSQQLLVTLIRRHTTPLRYSVQVPGCGSARAFKDKLAGMCQLHTDRLLLCKVSGGTVKALCNKGELNIVNDELGVDFYAYELELDSQPMVLLQRRVAADGQCSLVGDCPLVLSVQHTQTVEELLLMIKSCCSQFVSSGSCMGDSLCVSWVQPRGGTAPDTEIGLISNAAPDMPIGNLISGLTTKRLRFVAVDWSEEALEAGAVNMELLNACESDQSVERAESTQRLRRVGNAKTISIHDCFELFDAPAELDENNTWYCPECKEHVTASQQLQLWSAPEVLVLHLKRFSFSSQLQAVYGMGSKINSLVQFPVQGLDITPYLVHRSTGSTPAIYDLYAVSNHMGTMRGGHYTAYARGPNDQWNEFDDETVREVDAECVVSRSAYVLFYRLRQPAAASNAEPAEEAGSPPLSPVWHEASSGNCLPDAHELHTVLSPASDDCQDDYQDCQSDADDEPATAHPQQPTTAQQQPPATVQQQPPATVQQPPTTVQPQPAVTTAQPQQPAATTAQQHQQVQQCEAQLEAMRIDAQHCDHCNKQRNCKLCGKCHRANYCSRECQVAAWPAHKAECKRACKVAAALKK